MLAPESSTMRLFVRPAIRDGSACLAQFLSLPSRQASLGGRNSSKILLPKNRLYASGKISSVILSKSSQGFQPRFGSQKYSERGSESLARSLTGNFASRTRHQKFTNSMESNAVGERDDHLRSNYGGPAFLAVLLAARPYCALRSSSPA